MRLLVTSVLTLFCAACVPFYVETYYHPEAHTGIVRHASACGAGPSNRIKFTMNGIDVEHVAHRVDRALQVILVFGLPEGKTVKLQSRVVHIRVPGNSDDLRAEFTEATRGGQYPPPRQPADHPMIGGTRVFRGGFLPSPPQPVFYALRTQADVPDAEILSVKLPALEVNGDPVKLPEITLTRKKHFGLFETINC